jgi:tRNA (guanine26-N2/guanine27-N2)-dimethyltransferase
MMQFEEGKAVIKVPEFEKVTAKTPVFYNPHMAYDRELSRRVYNATKKTEVLDAFSGSGIRAILYALEGAKVTANDYNPKAVELIKKNAKLNNVSLKIMNKDANILFREQNFQVIDVDPFGSPAPYLDSIMHGLQNGSFLFVTATDTKALCGHAKKAALRKYGINTVKTPFSKELGVRVLLTAIMREGAKHTFGFDVLLSYCRQHYIRVFLRTQWSKKAAFDSMNLVSPVYVCECGFFTMKITEKCPYCNKIMKCIHSVYVGSIKDNHFLEAVEPNTLIEDVINELDTPFYYDTHALAPVFDFYPPKINEIVNKINENESKFSASRTIFCPTGIRTTMPFDTLITMIKEL